MTSKIKYILWDVDGTLYQDIPELSPYFKQVYINVYKSKFPQATDQEAWDIIVSTKQKTKSVTKAISQLTGMTVDRAGALFEELVPKEKYLKKNQELVKMFNKLLQLSIKNIALRNGTTANTEKIIKCLGLDEIKESNCKFGPFNQVIGVFDFFQTNKPDLKIFQYFIDNLGVKPAEILSVGDRVSIELEPAKQLGMQTALVWQQPKTEEAKYVDYVLPTVYEVPSILNTSLKD